MPCGKAAESCPRSSPGIQADLESLRSDISRITDQISDIVAAKGSAAWDRARSNIEGAVSDATGKGQEAVDAVREVGDNMIDAIDKSLKKRPYTTSCAGRRHRISARRHAAAISSRHALTTRHAAGAGGISS